MFIFYLNIRCLNHILNTVVQNNILESPEIKKKIELVRKIVGHSHRSSLFAEALRREFDVAGQTALCLIMDVQTRWNSTYDMLGRFVQVQDVIKALLANGWGKDLVGKDKPEVRITERDWNLLNAVTNVLRGFKEATESLSKESACVSQYIPTVYLLLKSLEINDEDNTETGRGVKGLKKRLSEDLQNRMDEIEIEKREIFSVATLLDPRYKGNFFQSEEAKKNAEVRLVELLKKENESVVQLLPLQSTEPSTTASSHDEGRSAFKRIYDEMKKKANNNAVSGENSESAETVISSYLNSGLENSNLFYWSTVAKTDQPIKKSLCKLAKKYLTPHPTSTNVERLFSTAGNVVKGRGRLKPKNVEKLVFLKENLNLNNFKLDW